jgi:ATP-dependent protease ClpP protease subunit
MGLIPMVQFESEESEKDRYCSMNSPGESVTAGLTLYDARYYACFTRHTGQSLKNTYDTDHDLRFTSQHALEYGMMDKVLISRSTKKS